MNYQKLQIILYSSVCIFLSGCKEKDHKLIDSIEYKKNRKDRKLNDSYIRMPKNHSYIGIPNTGSSCWLNSFVQGLSIKGYKDSLQEIKKVLNNKKNNKEEIPNYKKRLELVNLALKILELDRVKNKNKFQNLAIKFQNRFVSYHNKKLTSNGTDNIKKNEQRDPSEAIHYFYQYLNEDFGGKSNLDSDVRYLVPQEKLGVFYKQSENISSIKKGSLKEKRESSRISYNLILLLPDEANKEIDLSRKLEIEDISYKGMLKISKTERKFFDILDAQFIEDFLAGKKKNDNSLTHLYKQSFEYDFLPKVLIVSAHTYYDRKKGEVKIAKFIVPNVNKVILVSGGRELKYRLGGMFLKDGSSAEHGHWRQARYIKDQDEWVMFSDLNVKVYSGFEKGARELINKASITQLILEKIK